MNPEKINEIFDKIEKIGHIIIDIMFILFTTFFMISTHDLKLIIFFSTIIIVFISDIIRKIGYTDLSKILYKICLVAVVIEFLIYFAMQCLTGNENSLYIFFVSITIILIRSLIFKLKK